MGAITGLAGTAGGVNGTGFAAPTQANITSPVSAGQVGQASQGVSGALTNAGNFQNVLDSQGGQGVGNQTAVYNQGQQLGGQLAGNNGTGTMGAAGTQQNTLNTNLANVGGTTAMNQALAGQGALATNLGNVGGTTALSQALAGQGALANQLGSAGGIGAQTSAIQGLQGVAGQQQATANQLQGVANGTGPNPAQAMLNQQTGQNVANQAALMAGQRGAGANVGLMARQAAQQGAATQQQAVGQGATMQAQQSLGALGQMGAQEQAQAATQGQIANAGQGLTSAQQAALSQQAAQGQGATGLQQSALSQQAAQGQAAAGLQQQGIAQQFGQGATTTGLQQAQQGINAGIVQNQVGNTLAGQNQVIQDNVANAGQQIGALGNYNATAAGLQGNINSANAGLANTNMQGQQAMLGGALNGAGGAMSAVGSGGARGGMVRKMADGGEMTSFAAPEGSGPALAEPAAPAAPAGPAGTGPVGGVGPLANAAPSTGPQSSLGQYLAGQMDTGQFAQASQSGADNQSTQSSIANTPNPVPQGMGYGSQMLYQGMSSAAKGAMKMGSMAAMAASRGGLADSGGHVAAKSPDQKATKSGNSYSNDKVPALLSEGEVVIPRSVMQSRDPARSAADFVAKVLAKRRAS